MGFSFLASVVLGAAIGPEATFAMKTAKVIGNEQTLRRGRKAIGGDYLQSIAAGKDLTLHGRSGLLLLNKGMKDETELMQTSPTLELGKPIKVQTKAGERTFDVLPGENGLRIEEATGRPVHLAGGWANHNHFERRLQLVTDKKGKFFVVKRGHTPESDQTFSAKLVMGSGDVTHANYFLTDNNDFFVVAGGDGLDAGLRIDWLQPNVVQSFAEGPMQLEIPYYLDDSKIATNAIAKPTLIAPHNGDLIQIDWKNKTWRWYFSTFKIPERFEKRDLSIPVPLPLGN